MGYVPPMRPRVPWPPPPAALTRGSGNLPRVGPTCPDYYPPAPPVESDEQTIARYIGGNEGRFFIEDDAYILGRVRGAPPPPPPNKLVRVL